MVAKTWFLLISIRPHHVCHKASQHVGGLWRQIFKLVLFVLNVPVAEDHTIVQGCYKWKGNKKLQTTWTGFLFSQTMHCPKARCRACATCEQCALSVVPMGWLTLAWNSFASQSISLSSVLYAYKCTVQPDVLLTCNQSHNVFCTQETWGSFLLQEWTILGDLCILSFFGCLFSSYICCMCMKGVLIDLKKWTWSHSAFLTTYMTFESCMRSIMQETAW